MKVLHVIPHIWKGNGAAKLMRDLIEYQIHHGDRVTVIALVSCPPTCEEELKRLGCDVFCLKEKKNKYTLYNPFYIFRLRRRIKGYDIVHVHLFPALYWIAFTKWLFSIDAKLVYSEHSAWSNRQSVKVLKPIEKFVYAQYNAIVGVSSDVLEVLNFRFPFKEELYLINNGIKIDNFRLAPIANRKELGVPEETVFLLQVSKFDNQKDQKTVIRALSLLPNRFHVVFVGDGPLRVEHEALVKVNHLSDRVHFLGIRDDVPSILKAADIVILSTNYEGFGLAALEGMAACKPVIASDVEGLSAVVGGAGILFKLHDERDLAGYILRLSEDKVYYNEIAEKCFLRSKEYDYSVMGKSYRELYKKLMNKFVL